MPSYEQKPDRREAGRPNLAYAFLRELALVVLCVPDQRAQFQKLTETDPVHPVIDLVFVDQSGDYIVRPLRDYVAEECEERLEDLRGIQRFCATEEMRSVFYLNLAHERQELWEL